MNKHNGTGGRLFSHIRPEKVLCVYHSRDLDGWTSAAIVASYYGQKATLVGWDYGQPVPENIYLSYFDEIFLVDISFSPDVMKELSFDERVVWIDHHASAIKDAKENVYEFMNGIRDPRFAACELTWDYLYRYDMPRAIRLLGLYDSFRHMKDTPEVQEEVVNFQYAARANVAGPEQASIFRLMKDDQIDQWIMQGKAIHKYLTLEAQSTVKNAFPVKILGTKGSAVNATRLNPKNFGIEIPDGEFFGAFHYTGDMWVCSLYSDTVDCSVICKKLGGGGHPGAAGFQRKYFVELELIFNI